MLNSPVLVLNRYFFPVDITNVKRAFLMLYIGAAKAVDANMRLLISTLGVKLVF